MQLFYYSGKFGFALLWLLFLPIMLRRDYILQFWLENVPDYTHVFLLWIIIYSIVSIFAVPLWYAVQAVGKIGKYITVTNSIVIMSLPICWILLRQTFPPQIVYMVLVATKLFSIFFSLFIVKKYIDLSIRNYIVSVIFPCLLTVGMSFPVCWYINSLISDNFLGLVGSSVMCVLCNVFFIGFILLTKHQRMQILKLIQSKLGNVINK
jgi:hypothetical protein